MPGITTRRPRRGLPERYRSPSQRGTHSAGSNYVNARITEAETSTSVLTLTFDEPVSLSGVPNITTNVAETPVSATQPAANQVAITFTGNVSAATTVNIPRLDPAIRTASGGWAESGVFPIPE